MSTPRPPETLRWIGGTDGHLVLLDQTLLPTVCQDWVCHSVESLWEAIKSLRVRGAPAIGIAAAYGVCLGLPRDAVSETEFFTQLDRTATYLATSRPTAVNLFWALERMRRRASAMRGRFAPAAIKDALLAEARAIHEEDRATCRAIGHFGAQLLRDAQSVLTHCNAGGLATSEFGTALAAIFTCQDQGKAIHVYIDETRPLLQGARLTAWEVTQRGIPATLICDSMAAQVMKEGKVQAVIVGADRIAANGDTANKIGTYSLAVLARAHQIPFYVAAPTSTFDLSRGCGEEIPIEQRPPEEVTHGFGRPTAPPGIAVYNPAFDITPAEFITAIITERGVISPVAAERIAAVIGSRGSEN